MSFAPFDTSLIVERLVTQLPALHFVGGAADYAANSVWGLPGLAGIPIRIDCGDSDPFYAAKIVTARFFMQKLLPEHASLFVNIMAGGKVLMELPAEAF